jgi:hypothetical protein
MLLYQRAPLKAYLWCTTHPIKAYVSCKTYNPPPPKEIHSLGPLDLKIFSPKCNRRLHDLRQKSRDFRHNDLCDFQFCTLYFLSLSVVDPGWNSFSGSRLWDLIQTFLTVWLLQFIKMFTYCKVVKSVEKRFIQSFENIFLLVSTIMYSGTIAYLDTRYLFVKKDILCRYKRLVLNILDGCQMTDDSKPILCRTNPNMKFCCGLTAVFLISNYSGRTGNRMKRENMHSLILQGRLYN